MKNGLIGHGNPTDKIRYIEHHRRHVCRESGPNTRKLRNSDVNCSGCLEKKLIKYISYKAINALYTISFGNIESSFLFT